VGEWRRAVEALDVNPAGSERELPADFVLVIRPRGAVSLRDLAELWRKRELLWTLAMRDVSVRYKQAALGVAWALLQPAMQMIVYTLLFNRVAGIRADAGVPYPLFCFAGVVVWSLFANGLQRASESLVDNAQVITKVYFPRVVVPVAAIMAAAVDFVIGFLLLLILMPIFGASFHASTALAPLLALLAALAALSLGLWTSAVNIQYRDVRYALPFFIQMLIFVTPVFYPASMIPARWRFLLDLNPMAAVVDGFRAAMFGTAMPWMRLGASMALCAVVGAVGFIYFRHMERTFADRA
jgi:lipopolysaccharide transport system permease protein